MVSPKFDDKLRRADYMLYAAHRHFSAPYTAVLIAAPQSTTPLRFCRAILRSARYVYPAGQLGRRRDTLKTGPPIRLITGRSREQQGRYRLLAPAAYRAILAII